MSERSIDTGTNDVTAEINDGVMTITLNRPDRRNALSDPMLLSDLNLTRAHVLSLL